MSVTVATPAIYRETIAVQMWGRYKRSGGGAVVVIVLDAGGAGGGGDGGGGNIDGSRI